MGMQYEPTLEVDTADPFDFSPRLGDTTRPIFGFGYIRGYIETNSNNDNFNRLQLFTDSLENGVVLSEPWVNNNWVNFITVKDNEIENQIVYNIYNKPDEEPKDREDELHSVEYQGVNFYISINLRRLGTDNVINNDTVLSIRMPFVNLIDAATERRRTGYIRYNLLPDTAYTDTTHCPHNRGVIRNVREIDGGEHDSVIYITRDMIPTTSETDRDITISAHFICDGDHDLNNYGLETFPEIADSLTIDSLKIEVHYYDNADLAIDWLRIETRPAREL
jgi:hypothetical protein